MGVSDEEEGLFWWVEELLAMFGKRQKGSRVCEDVRVCARNFFVCGGMFEVELKYNLDVAVIAINAKFIILRAQSYQFPDMQCSQVHLLPQNTQPTTHNHIPLMKYSYPAIPYLSFRLRTQMEPNILGKAIVYSAALHGPRALRSWMSFSFTL